MNCSRLNKVKERNCKKEESNMVKKKPTTTKEVSNMIMLFNVGRHWFASIRS